MSTSVFNVIRVPKEGFKSAMNNSEIAQTTPESIMTAIYDGKCDVGMFGESDSKSGDISLHSTAVYQDLKQKYVNAFKLNNCKTFVIEKEDSSNGNNNTYIYFIMFINNNEYTIYSTNGNVKFDKDDKVIYTDANSFFKPVDTNTMNVSHWDVFNPSQQLTQPLQQSSAQITLENITEISQMITFSSGYVVYYLNCIKNPLGYITDIDDDMKKIFIDFLTILTVEIILGNDYAENNKFLVAIERLNINSDFVNNTASDILGAIKRNPYQIYISSLDLPNLILKLSTEFPDIIYNTYIKQKNKMTTVIANLKDTRTEEKKQKAQKAQQIIKDLIKKIQKENKYVECFLMLNLKKQPESDVLQTKNPRFTISIENSPDYDDFVVINSGTKMKKFVEGDSRELTCAFGPFKKVFPGDATNSEIASNGEIKKLLFSLRDQNILFIVGLGGSGAGKTSKLVYFNKGNDDSEGIIIKMCIELKKNQQSYGSSSDKSDKNDNTEIVGDKIVVRRIEVCPTPRGERDYACKKDDTDYDFVWDNEQQNFICETQSFIPNNSERLKKEKVECGKDNQDYNSCTIRGQTLGQAIEKFVDKDRHVNATTNNVNSSRSHDLLFIFIKINGVQKVIIIGDFAGVENEFICTDLKTYMDFGNLNKDVTSATQGQTLTKYYNGANGSNVIESREDIFDFAEYSKLYGIVKPPSKDKRNQWIKDLYKVLLGFRDLPSEQELTPTLLSDAGIDYAKFFQPKTFSKDDLPEIVNKIKNNTVKTGDTISAPTEISWQSTKEFLTNPRTKGIKKFSLFSNDSNFVVGYKNTDYVYLSDIFDNYEDECKRYKKGNNESVKLTISGKKCIIVKNVNGKCYIIFPRIGSSNTLLIGPAIRFHVDSNEIHVDAVNSFNPDKVDDIGVTYSNHKATYKKGENLDTSVFEETFTREFVLEKLGLDPNLPEKDVLVKFPESIEDFNTWKQNATKNTVDTNGWARGNDSIEFYMKLENRGKQMIALVTLNKRMKDFVTLSGFDQLANQMVKGWNATGTDETKTKAQFVKDLVAVHTKIKLHREVKVISQENCELRSNEGKFINSNIRNSDNSVQINYNLQNNGKPFFPKFVPGNDDFFQKKHIFEVIEKTEYTTQTFKESVEKSQIMKSIYELCSEKRCFEGKVDDLETYKQFSNNLSVVYFLVFDISESANKDNKIQYIHKIDELYVLLKEVQYDMKFEALKIINFSAKAEGYKQRVRNTIEDINFHFTNTGGIKTGYGENTGLTIIIPEITDMFKIIGKQITKLNSVNSFSGLIDILNEIIKSIYVVNITTPIGPLQMATAQSTGVPTLIKQASFIKTIPDAKSSGK